MPHSKPSPQLPEQLTLDLTPLGVSNLVCLQRYDYHRAYWTLPDHIHEGVMEVTFLVRGVQGYRVGGKRFNLQGGDILVTRPDEKHSSNGKAMESSKHYTLLIDMRSETADGFLDLPAEEGRLLRSRLLDMGDCVLRGAADVQQRLEAIVQAWLQDEATRTTQIRTCVIDILLHLVRLHDNPNQREISPPILDAIAWIRSHIEEVIELEDLARVARLSLSRFKQRFHDETGVPPREFVLRQKIARAQEMLRQGQSVTVVAHALEFSSSQYFATVFRRFENMSPSQFARSSQES